MEIRQLQQFLAVVEEGSVSAAARRLHMAQSPLSRAVRGLERELGAALFTRSARGVTLTPAGRVLQEEARAVLDRLAAATERVRGVGPVQRPVVLASIVDLPPGWLAAASAGLARAEPPLRLELREGTSSSNPTAVARGRVDLALTREALDPPGCRRRLLMAEPFGVVLPATHPLADGPAAVGREQLVDLGRWLAFPRPHAPGWFDEIAAFVRSAGLGIDDTAATDARDVKLDRVALGRGLAFAPAWQAAALRQHGVAWLPLAGAPLVRRTSVVTRLADETGTGRTGTVVACLAEAVAPSLRPG